MSMFQSEYLSLLHTDFFAQLLLGKIVGFASLLYVFTYLVCLNTWLKFYGSLYGFRLVL